MVRWWGLVAGWGERVCAGDVVSLLDIIGPVMVGPSSSHTAGACRIGLLARAMLGTEPERAEIGLHGSFASTGLGHGTDLALLAGLLGWTPDDTRLPAAEQEARRRGLEFDFYPIDLGEVHPNSVRIKLAGAGEKLSVTASSIGGGVVEVSQIDDFPVRLSGALPTLLLRYRDHPGVIAKVTGVLAEQGVNVATLTCNRLRRGGWALMAVEMDVAPSESAQRRIAALPEMVWVRQLPSVMA